MNYLQMSELYHHGIKGQKWGIRRFENEDGTLNAKGLKRQQKINAQAEKYEKKAAAEAAVGNKEASKAYSKVADNLRKQDLNSKTYDEIRRSDRGKIGRRAVAGLLIGATITTGFAKNKYRDTPSSATDHKAIMENIALGTWLCGAIGLASGAAKYKRSTSIDRYNSQFKNKK